MPLEQTYALQCKEKDFPKLTDATRLEVMQTLAQLAIVSPSAVSKAKTAESIDHVKFCRRVAAVLPVDAVTSVPLMSHDIAKACAPDRFDRGH